MPATTALRRLRDDRVTQLLFARYLAIGGFVFCLDVGSFRVLYLHGTALWLATALSYLLAVAAHFTLNRFFNFRNFERTMLQQVRTYAVVAAGCLLIQEAVVIGFVDWLHLPALAAKIAGVAINIPIGFIGHRYLTFGGGIARAIRKLRAS